MRRKFAANRGRGRGPVRFVSARSLASIQAQKKTGTAAVRSGWGPRISYRNRGWVERSADPRPETRYAIVASWEGERLPTPLHGVRILAIALQIVVQQCGAGGSRRTCGIIMKRRVSGPMVHPFLSERNGAVSPLLVELCGFNSHRMLPEVSEARLLCRLIGVAELGWFRNG